MKRLILITLMTLTALSATEPSAYGAGNLDSASPYGLTETERSILENRKAMQDLRNKISQQQNRIDGLTTIVEGLNREILNLKEQSRTGGGDVVFQLKQLVQQINSNYVTQVDLEEALRIGKVVKRQQDTYLNSDSGNSNQPVTNNNTEDDRSAYTKAVQLFGQGNYQSAKESFEVALANGNKKAPTNYYLGEIAYYTKDYANAVSYYKQSAALNNTATYMKILYLHTGIALARDGKDDNAKPFFQFVVDNYPDTKAAEIAQKNL